MQRRQVTGVTRDDEGDIVGICGPWGATGRATAIQVAKRGLTQYYVVAPSGEETIVTTPNGNTGPYLRTDWDQTTRNNLEDLPDC